MKKDLRHWILTREEGAELRLDAIRSGLVTPIQASLGEALAEVFRPNLRTWAALAMVWIALAALHVATAGRQPPPPRWAGRAAEETRLMLTNETLPDLDHHS